MIAGMPLLLTEARGPGQVAFSRQGTGHVFPLHLRPGSAVEVREHQYLTATGNLEYGFTRQKGIRNMLFGSTRFFVDRFAPTQSEGVLWLHGYGNVFEKVLGPGEQIDVEPGSWIYRDESVRMDPQLFGLRTGMFGRHGQSRIQPLHRPGPCRHSVDVRGHADRLGRCPCAYRCHGGGRVGVGACDRRRAYLSESGVRVAIKDPVSAVAHSVYAPQQALSKRSR
jgi:biogenesis AIM24-like protein